MQRSQLRICEMLFPFQRLIMSVLFLEDKFREERKKNKALNFEEIFARYEKIFKYLVHTTPVSLLCSY